MKVYKASEIKKFRDNASINMTDNFLCTIVPHIHNKDNFFLAYFDFDDNKWYVDEYGDTALDVKYFAELPGKGEFNEAIETIKEREDIEKGQRAIELLEIAVGNIDDGIFLKEEIREFLDDAVW